MSKLNENSSFLIIINLILDSEHFFFAEINIKYNELHLYGQSGKTGHTIAFECKKNIIRAKNFQFLLLQLHY